MLFCCYTQNCQHWRFQGIDKEFSLCMQRQHRAPRCAAGTLHEGPAAKPAFPPGVGYGISEEEDAMPLGTPLQKGTLVARLLAAKEASGKTFSDIAAEVGLTNVYCTQLFFNQVSSLVC